ncbi:MAG: Eco57I restriction-modification methylase domain-containing protein, partial [bacterium]
NRAGNYLLVLTNDYERIDFVLLEKYLPTSSRNGMTIGTQQVGVRARSLTVNRRDPNRVQLRVLRRFTYTEGDPIAQFEKLLSAYSVADWSEEFFNNRALFSDYYLLTRLRDFPEWAEDPKPTYLTIRDLYRDARGKFGGVEKERVCSDLYEPLFKILGFKAEQGKNSHKSKLDEPTYRLLSTKGGSTLALCLAYPWGRSLDGKDDQRDKATPEENPGARVVSLLEKGEAPWAVVTNGKIWRLYSAKTHSRATNYYEIDLEEVLAEAGRHAGDPAESFRYFWLLFRRQSFEPVEVEREGRKLQLAFLDRLLAESEDYAKELGDRLKDRAFLQVFPQLAAGFISHIREQEGLRSDIPQTRLDEIYQGTLTLLYRILFLLYAEARDLLPVREKRGYFEASFTKIKQEVAEGAGTIADSVEENLKKKYRRSNYDLYERLARLCQVVDHGDPAVNVPVYNGGLFISDPEPEDRTSEANNARFLSTHKVPDFYLARALDLLARDLDPSRHDLVFVDYKSLGVRQLGSIYEGLLEFTLRIADRKLGVKKVKGREVYGPFPELNERERASAERSGRVVKKDNVYIENDKRERKATGSYYTPDHIVKYIVENAVGPVLNEKFEKIRPKLRQAQIEHKAFFDKQKALREKGMKTEPESKADLIGRETLDDIFDLKVLDPAMGSGHFLVEAVDFITDRMLDFLNAFPWNPVTASLTHTRETILKEMDEQGITIDPKRLTDVNLLKRHILKRCIYGVDLNPMAVELAKVSLWLDCFTLGAPLSFLDHHLRCGNSLIGVTVEEVRKAVEGGQSLLWGSRFAGLMLATDLMRHVGDLSDVTSAQVKQSRAEYRRASDELAPFKRILDVYTSQWFGNAAYTQRKGRISEVVNPAISFLKSAESDISFIDPDKLNSLDEYPRKIAETALKVAEEKKFFHWELEFPEVYYGPREGTTQDIKRKKGAGFDAIIGNPPYIRIQTMKKSDPAEVRIYKDMFKSARSGNYDIYVVFVEKGLQLLDLHGQLAFILPSKFFATDYGAALRRVIAESRALRKVVDFGHATVFDGASNYTCLLFLSRSPMTAAKYARVASPDTLASRDIESAFVECRGVTSEPWMFAGEMEQSIVDKMGQNAVALGQLPARIARGSSTGHDDVFMLTQRGRDLITRKGQSVDIESGILRTPI